MGSRVARIIGAGVVALCGCAPPCPALPQPTLSGLIDDDTEAFATAYVPTRVAFDAGGESLEMEGLPPLPDGLELAFPEPGDPLNVNTWRDDSSFEPAPDQAHTAAEADVGFLDRRLFGVLVLSEQVRRPEILVHLEDDEACTSPLSQDAVHAGVQIPSDEGDVVVPAGSAKVVTIEEIPYFVQTVIAVFFNNCNDKGIECGFGQVIIRRVTG